jgi:hypothetical protein
MAEVEEKLAVEFPKWIVPHASHVARQKVDQKRTRPGSENSLRAAGADEEHISTPAWPDFHVSRITGEVTVLVKDAKEEALALAEYVAPKEKPKDADLSHVGEVTA